MYFPEPVYDAYSGLNVRTAGCRALNGFQALEVVRARHLQYKSPTTKTNVEQDWPQDPQSDLSRIRRDHEFLRVLGSAVAARGIGNPVTDNSLLGAVAPQLKVDQSFSLGSMFGMVLTFHGVSPSATPQKTLPVIVLSSLNYVYGGVDYGNVELMSQPDDMAAVTSFLGVTSDQDTMTGRPLPSPSSVTVSVLNGTGTTGQAGQASSSLRALGYNVVGSGDARATGSLAEALVTYSSTSHLGDAEQRAALAVGVRGAGQGPDRRRCGRHGDNRLQLLGGGTGVLDPGLVVGRLVGLVGWHRRFGPRPGRAHPAEPAAGTLRPPLVHGLGGRGALTRDADPVALSEPVSRSGGPTPSAACSPSSATARWG